MKYSHLLPKTPVSFRHFLLILCLLQTQCSHFYLSSDNVTSETTETASNDTFTNLRDELTKNVKIYKNFETIYALNATYLSKEFVAELKKEHNKHYPFEDNLFANLDKGNHFFVSLYSPSDDLEQFINPDIWTIFLNIGKIKVKPNHIKPVYPKEKLKLFFPFINKWTDEYLLSFDKIIDQKLNLVLINTQSSAKIQW